MLEFLFTEVTSAGRAVSAHRASSLLPPPPFPASPPCTNRPQGPDTPRGRSVGPSWPSVPWLWWYLGMHKPLSPAAVPSWCSIHVQAVGRAVSYPCLGASRVPQHPILTPLSPFMEVLFNPALICRGHQSVWCSP